MVFNRVQGDNRSADELQAAVGLPVLGVVPYDPTLQEYDAKGKSLLELPDNTVALACVDEVINKVFR